MNQWSSMAANLAWAGWIGAAAVVVFYWLRLAGVKGYKDKYDFIVEKEINYHLAASYLLVAGFFFYLSSWLWQKPHDDLVRGIEIVYTIAAAIVVALIFRYLFRVYYPGLIEKRIHDLRYHTRLSPKTGRPMRLLTEEEEDVHLDESQREDENILSVDYDVWKDEDTGYLQIEKYNPKHHAIKCPECDYQTLRLIREEVVRQPTATENGIMVKHYRCSYCKHLAKKTVELKPAVAAEKLATAT
jgi:hypothetical protein